MSLIMIMPGSNIRIFSKHGTTSMFFEESSYAMIIKNNKLPKSHGQTYYEILVDGELAEIEREGFEYV